MPGLKLSTSSRDGRVVVALRGHLDVSGAAEAGAAITALAVPSQYLVVGLSALDFTGAGQLEAALNSRVTIEQGNGKLAGRYGTSMGYAFTMPRNHPRNAGQHLADVARASSVVLPRNSAPGTAPAVSLAPANRGRNYAAIPPVRPHRR